MVAWAFPTTWSALHLFLVKVKRILYFKFEYSLFPMNKINIQIFVLAEVITKYVVDMFIQPYVLSSQLVFPV